MPTEPMQTGRTQTERTWRVGVDSGGTFTDVCLFDEATGRTEVWKVSSTPSDPSEGIAAGVAEGMARVVPGEDKAAARIAYFGHGTTVATNALITHRGALVGLVTSEGFRDLLEIGRQKRPSLYDLFEDKPHTLVARRLRKEAAERLRHDGTVETPLDEDAVRRAARELAEAGCQAVAICFLYSFVDPTHEARARAIVAEELPDAFICASHEIAPEFREFERLSTAVVNAYLGPIMKRYIDRLTPRLEALGMAAPPHLTQSNGGVVSFEAASRTPVRAVLSGPSTGVVAAEAIGREAGFSNLITFDMGGTSTDVALMQGGQPKLASEAIVHGYPIKAPMLDIHTVGAGGGSIAYIDSGGLLKVGPQSAGADPGPVCYDRGATAPTVTDANVVLGTLNPTHLLAGRMPIRRDLAEEAIAGLGAALGLSTMETAEGILAVVTANMARAIRTISVQRGHDPRDYALMAFGGAGPLHAARLAEALDMSRIVIPPSPGIMCAIGLLLTDLRADFAATRLMPAEPANADAAEATLAPLVEEAESWLAAEHVAPDARRLSRTVDMRYRGQNYELAVRVPEGPVTAAAIDALVKGFEDAHKQRYGFLAEEEAVEFVTFRVEAFGVVRKAEFPRAAPGEPDPAPAATGTRQTYFAGAGEVVATPVYAREKLRAGMTFEGPAIVEQMDTTTIVPPGTRLTVDAMGNLIMEAS
ncbi:hydantoinase/oxoprolinase family protein [Acuticoccus sediminis]|uniref:hydantoinase/oxoprolinase family protein n=1 Tax=Acuticoccus sediminis TaxID=2184697 RepID=UPI001CFCAC33|nr:hydantoinase/oxoprolinase family protein [Acuticoccus sediminis]